MADRARLILASASPRRHALLEQVGIACDAHPADVDESRRDGEPAAAYVQRLARAKAERVAARMPDGRPVLGADTAVVVDADILGKPRDRDDAQRMLRLLSGRTHEVLSAVALFDGGRCAERLSRTAVTMRPLGDDEIAAYCAGEEPWDKAGAYALQGRAAAFVQRIDGSYSGVVGLPLYETLELLAAVRP